MSVQLVPKTVRSLLLQLTVPGEPVPKERARVTRRGTFTPVRTASHEAMIGMLARGKVQTPTPDPVIVEADFYVGNRRRVDWDNLSKCATDSLNGVAWDDDSQIVEAHIRKFVDKAEPRTEIRVWRVA